MYRINRSKLRRGGRQTGTALIVTLVLVLLATLLAVFAMNVGMFEQRASGTDVRSRLVQQTTEAALSQGMEYFRAHTDLVDLNAVDSGGTKVWDRCSFDDDSFPCGTVETFAIDGVTSRRATMYRFVGGTADVNGDGTVDAMEQRMVPLDRHLTTVGNGFAVQYGTGALLCMVQTPKVSTDPTTCTTDPLTAVGINVLTLTAVGSIPGESARTTLSQSVGSHSLLSSPAGKPPVVASGSANLLGTMQIVTNPNAAGPGVPVTTWTRQALTGSGTPNTCYLDEFIRFGALNNKPPQYEGSKPPIITCDTCNCETSHSLSAASGNTVAGGIDVLYGPPGPVGGPDTQTTGFTNFKIRLNEFPCDMFAFVFKQTAWQDTDADYFCETALLADYTVNGVTTTNGRVDEGWLYENATHIIPRDTADPRIPASKLATCSYLNSAASGLVWDQTQCGIGSNVQVGTPDTPVLLVSDGGAPTSIQGRMFGLLFIRSTTSPITTAGGGDGDLEMNAGAVIYGSVVVQGTISRANGTAAVVYNESVLSNLGRQPAFNPFSPVPASWTDRFAY